MSEQVIQDYPNDAAPDAGTKVFTLSPDEADLAWVDSANLPGVVAAQGDADTALARSLPAGGTEGQVLGKATGTDYDTEWIDPPEGGEGGGGPVSADEVTVDDTGGFFEGTEAETVLAEVGFALSNLGTAAAEDTSAFEASGAIATHAAGTGVHTIAGVTGLQAALDALDTDIDALDTALDGKQPIDSDLTAIAALTTTSFGLALLELANAGALLTAAGGLPENTFLWPVDGDWPEAANDGRIKIWIQYDPEGTAPPAGGRPGREPGDLVLIAQQVE